MGFKRFMKRVWRAFRRRIKPIVRKTAYKLVEGMAVGIADGKLTKDEAREAFIISMKYGQNLATNDAYALLSESLMALREPGVDANDYADDDGEMEDARVAPPASGDPMGGF